MLSDLFFFFFLNNVVLNQICKKKSETQWQKQNV